MIKMKNPENKVEWKTFDGVMDPKDILIFTLRFSVPKNELNNMRRYINGDSRYSFVNDGGIFVPGMEDSAVEDFKTFFKTPKKGIIRLPNGWIKFFRSDKYIMAYWVDDNGTHTEKFDDWKSITKIAKEEIALKTLPNDIDYKGDDFIEMLIKILKRIPGYDDTMEEFKNTHHYRNRSDLLRERLNIGVMHDSLKDDVGMYEIDLNDRWDIMCKYKDSRHDTYAKIFWSDLEKYFYEKYEMHDVIGQEHYTESDILKLQINNWLKRKTDDELKEFKENFLSLSSKDKIDAAKKLGGADSWSGYGTPLHKHEYGLHQGSSMPKALEICWRDLDGDHEKKFTWREVANMIETMSKS